MHGHDGLSPSICEINEINSIRKGPLPVNGPASDLAWSDPGEDQGWKESPRVLVFFTDGPDVIDQFNHTNKI